MKPLFRSKTGMHLLAFPTTSADRENTRRRDIGDVGSVSAFSALNTAQIAPQNTLLCGPIERMFSVLDALQRQSTQPFVLIGTKRDFTDSPLLRLDTQWEDTSLPERLPDGNGRITLRADDLTETMERLPELQDRLLILCLGHGLAVNAALMNQLNAAGNYLLVTNSLSGALFRSADFTEETLLSSMQHLVVSSIGGGSAETLLKVLPDYECEKVTNNFNFSTHRDRGGMMGCHGGSGLQFGQNREIVTKHLLSEDDLTRLSQESAMILYNARLRKVWVGKIS